MTKTLYLAWLLSLCPLLSFGQAEDSRNESEGNRVIIDPGTPFLEYDLEASRVYAPDSSSADSHPVGSVRGDFGVSAMGGATYSIHIDCPKGVGIDFSNLRQTTCTKIGPVL